ncbi:MAG TPA: hypothetical protein VN792_05010 [Candidatus Acidoferrales bacterium]|nr:hypothetical protein [Candidatus Acidoferrales bacterium]
MLYIDDAENPLDEPAAMGATQPWPIERCVPPLAIAASREAARGDISLACGASR